ncbi:hypothetical protein [Marinobacter sp. F4216]|uniref:hypothetical protein n=1 Tax=Marinobacter sp. F4216 TaxID=2874281 RepID=UPI001CC17CD1|nr:hypothetical protein [Marinobacter sp. F4216]MBZ2169466.1 hypothetical protein [Marinobacter sp. F4216]
MLKNRTYAAKLGLISAFIAMGLGGCSEYPGDGRLDTSAITSSNKIVDIRGEVYGVKPDAVAKVSALRSDNKAIYALASSETQALIAAGETIPDLVLEYPKVDGLPDMSSFQATILEGINKVIAENKSTYDTNLAEAEAKVAELEAERADLMKVTAKFDAAVASEKKALESAEAELSSAISDYSSVIETAEADINKLALPKNLTDIGRFSNPVTKYRYIDYAERNARVPSSCPQQRGYETVDLRSELSSCMYIRLPDDYGAIKAQVVGIVKQGIIDVEAASKRMGEKGSWRSKATGAYLAVANAEQALKQAQKKARAEFGDTRRQQYELRDNERKLAGAQQELTEMKSDEFKVAALSGEGYEYDAYYMHNFEEAKARHKAYMSAVKADAMRSIVKTAPLEFDAEAETATFSGVDGEFDALMVLGDVIVETGRGRTPVTMLQYVNLTDPAIKESDELVVVFDRDAGSNAGTIDRDDAEEMQDKLIYKVQKDVSRMLAETREANDKAA